MMNNESMGGREVQTSLLTVGPIPIDGIAILETHIPVHQVEQGVREVRVDSC